MVYDEEKSPMMTHDFLNTWSHEVTWQIKSLISPITKSLWPPNLTGRWLMMRKLFHNVTWPSDYVVTWSHVTNAKLNISFSKRYMIIKLCRVVANDEGNSSIVSQDSLTMKSTEVMWQTKNKFSSLAQRLWPPNLARWRLIMSHNVTWCCDTVVTWGHVTN